MVHRNPHMTTPGSSDLIWWTRSVILPLSPLFSAPSAAALRLTAWLWLSSHTRTPGYTILPNTTLPSYTDKSRPHPTNPMGNVVPVYYSPSCPPLRVSLPSSCVPVLEEPVLWPLQPRTFPQSDSAVPHPPLVCTGAQIGCHTATLGLGRQVHRPVINWLWFSGRKIPRRAATDFGREKKEKESLVDRTEYITPYILLGDWLFKIPASFPHSIPCSSRRIYPRVYF